MEMAPDEIVVRYRQAKKKGEQLNILAQLNACSVDDIVNVLVEHGGYKLDRLSRSRGKAKLLKKEESDKIVDNLMRIHVDKAIKKAADKQLEKAKNITPVMALEPEPKLKTYKQSIDSALDTIRAEIEDINRQQFELDQRKADIYQKLWDMLGGVS
jgi:leucyl aminopeptidase (aminopeptidase T)